MYRTNDNDVTQFSLARAAGATPPGGPPHPQNCPFGSGRVPPSQIRLSFAWHFVMKSVTGVPVT
jgi:hypothetical protein